MKDNRQSGNGAIYDSTFVVSAFSGSHEGCLTLPLWAKMTYNNCKFAYNLNKFSRPFHHLSAECKKNKEIKRVSGPLLLFVDTYLYDTRLSNGIPLAFWPRCHHPEKTTKPLLKCIMWLIINSLQRSKLQVDLLWVHPGGGSGSCDLT